MLIVKHSGLLLAGSPQTYYIQGFIQNFFLAWGGGWGGNLHACKGCMCVSVHPLGFNEILDIFKDKKHQIQL